MIQSDTQGKPWAARNGAGQINDLFELLQNDWEDIKRVMRFWVVEHGVKFIFLDNVTQLVSHLSATEINSEVSRIAVELAGMCNELEFTCFVFSHLNPPKTGAPHEEG